MWGHLNLIDFQRYVAIKKLDQEIAQDHADGYGPDVDRALERRHELMRLMREERESREAA